MLLRRLIITSSKSATKVASASTVTTTSEPTPTAPTIAAVSAVIVVAPISAAAAATSAITAIVPVIAAAIAKVVVATVEELLILHHVRIHVAAASIHVTLHVLVATEHVQQGHYVHRSSLHVAVWTTALLLTIEPTSAAAAVVKASTALILEATSLVLEVTTTTAKVITAAVVEVVAALVVHVTTTSKVPASTAKRRSLLLRTAIVIALTKVSPGQLAQPLRQRPIIASSLTATIPIVTSPSALPRLIPIATSIPEVPASPSATTNTIPAISIVPVKVPPSSTITPSTAAIKVISTISTTSAFVVTAHAVKISTRLAGHRIVPVEIRWHQRGRWLVEERGRIRRWLQRVRVGILVLHLDVHLVAADQVHNVG